MRIPKDIRPDERILVLGIPEADELGNLAGRVPAGLVVALGDASKVHELRRSTAHLDNVMLTPGAPEEIPWRDGFFTRVIDLAEACSGSPAVQREVDRVTAR